MADKHHPHRGSRGYSPRKRAKSHIARFGTWPDSEGDPKLQGFAGYKAGMTHAFIRDYRKESTTAGQEVAVPVTILEVPPMKIVAVRLYRLTPYGIETLTEHWATKLDKELERRIVAAKKEHKARLDSVDLKDVEDVRVLAMTQPTLLTGVPKKVPDLMELRVGGSDLKKRLDYAKSLLGKEVKVTDFVKEGEMIDVIAITKGKGFQGSVKRWGHKLLMHKDSKHRRKVGAMGPWHPSHTMSTVPLTGQVGYHQRTEYNKRVLRIGEDGKEITPAGGFVRYGDVRNPWMMLHGTIPGPSKRLIRLRDPVRFPGESVGTVEVTYTSTASKQGG